MKIAQIAPLYESVPPKKYGGTERIVSYLTEELISRGHDVTLFASGDSITKAKLISVCKTGLREDVDCSDSLAYHIIQLKEVIERASEFDILHFHTDYLHFPFTDLVKHPELTTLHGRLDLPDLIPLYRKFKEVPLVGISNSQKSHLPFANWLATVYHGLPGDLYQPGSGNGDYLAFIGRISPEKRVDRAIELAKRTGIPLRIAAKVDKADEKYFQEKIVHLLDHPLVEFIGEIGDDEKDKFLGDSLAMLFPIDWPEPFGLVLIECLACGTPVVAYNRGSVPEIIDHGITGYVVSSIDEGVKAINNLHKINRSMCRQQFEERFSASIMARNYELIYDRLREKKREKPSRQLSTLE